MRLKNILRHRKVTPPHSSGENFLLVTYDSCRYDTYMAARTPILDQFGEVRKAYSQATYTYASHASMFQGLLPHVFKDEDYYNRFTLQMWRLQHRKKVKARVVFPEGSTDIIDGFNKLGYFTCGVAAMGWFRNNRYLQSGWQAYQWTGIAGRKQVHWTVEQIERQPDKPFFAFINFGETHSPYKCEGQAGLEGDAPARERWKRTGGEATENEFDEASWKMQITCAEFLDARMGDLLQEFRRMNRDVTVVMCGDHGECFGEEGQYGHGFYHPKIMEVPMLVFDFKAK